MEEEHIEDDVEENPKDDTQDVVSRGEDLDEIENDAAANTDMEEDPRNDISTGVSRDVNDVDAEPKDTFAEDVLKEVIASVGMADDPKEGQGWEMCILDGMVEENRGITELSEHLVSKIFTDNQKEKMTWVKLKEIKTYRDNFSKELKNLSINLKRTILQVADLVSENIKDQSTKMQLKVEESGMDLKHLIEQKFLEHDTRLHIIEETVKDDSKS
ncbi:hypothetical protein Dimus_005368 [Dionaea muscipula]